MSEVPPDLARYAEDMHQAIVSEAATDEDGQFREQVFTQHMIDLLEEFGELDDGTVCGYQKRGMKVSGYSISQDGSSIDLLVSVCAWNLPPERMPKAAITTAAKQCRSFLFEAIDGHHKKMDEASPAFDLALRIHEARADITKARILILTDGIAPVDAIEAQEHETIEITHEIWDIERIHRCHTSGNRREPIVIDFNDFGGPLPVLKAADEAGTYSSYLAIVPGDVLARIYERWGTRLLERNVRAFLQARGGVNRGIRETILHEPHMFLTYNNGISVTAGAAEMLSLEGGGIALGAVRDFQVVNGGQTTASLYHARRKDKADLAQIQVQMKLTVVNDAQAIEELVPLISQYANTQNRITMADFASNDPFHRQVEELSRTIWVRDPAGGRQQTHWFYERARGQYDDERHRAGTAARQRAFEWMNPRPQVFTKTDLAKVENTWNELPHIVSRGAQKNFAEFSVQIAEGGGIVADQAYFERLIPKLILFRKAEKIVGAQGFGGYRAQIVAYTLSLLFHLAEHRLDLHRIWNDQDLPSALRAEIERLSHVAHRHLINPPGGQNITEWAKKAECWVTLRAAGATLSPQTLLELTEAAEPDVVQPTPGPNEEEEAISQVRAIPAKLWIAMYQWAVQSRQLDAETRSVLHEVGDRLRRNRRPIHAREALEAYEEGLRRGFRPS